MSGSVGDHITPRWTAWITEGFVLAVAPIIGFFVAFVYETAYAGIYRMPIEFISVGLNDVIAITFVLGGLAGVTWMLFGDVYVQFYTKRADPVYRRLVTLLPFVILFVIHAFLFRSLWREYLFAITYLAGFLFFEFAFPLITQRNVSGYRDKLIAQDKIDDAARPGPLRGFIAREGGRPAQILILILIGVVITANSAGRASALMKAEYLVPSDLDGVVVLRVYGDHLVCAPFDRDKKTIRPEFFVMPVIDPSGQRSLNLRKVGPLKVEAAT